MNEEENEEGNHDGKKAGISLVEYGYFDPNSLDHRLGVRKHLS